MHIEKNVFDNMFNTVMDIKGKTKDNINARRDLMIKRNRPELELDERRPNITPKAMYTLWKEQNRRVCEWIRGLKFLDGYVSNLARCVDMIKLRMHGMKSHDYHVFINDECTSSNDGIQLSIFNYPGRASGATKKKWLSGSERHIIEMYILTNCEVVTPHYDAEVTSFSAYFVNEYNFQTKRHNTGKSTMKCGICVKSSLYINEENDFYGIIEETIQLTYPLFRLAHRAVQMSLDRSSSRHEDEDEDNGGDDETNDEEYEAT
ncbi:hypothetical protein Sango_1881900 [Sesamum angolense]|uniref:Uncharacterized protein n=1 Tax=Sesamum angolense TaxID=2727404 RepID=A0AAE1WJ30_9LAMI|nr:hypothetical protein Sango_1881900 [Sesamum angolense]